MASKGISKKATHSQQQQAQAQEHQQIALGMVQPSSSLSGSFMNKDAGAYDLGELDQALFLYLDGHEHPSVQEQKQTLNIFPSQPMHIEPSTKGSLGMGSPTTFAFKRPSNQSLNSTRSQLQFVPDSRKDLKSLDKQRDGRRKATTSSSEQESPKTFDPKTLRRLAQNREAARKSRLRKKAYIQQLESSRIKLTQLEQELQRARSQGMLIGGGLLGDQGILSSANYITSDASMFDTEYARWLEEHHHLMWELRVAMQEHVPENKLKMFVDNCLTHYDEIIILKSIVAKSDIFHLMSGMWKSPAERCFMWLGGFRPSDLIKILLSRIEPLTEQQMMRLYSLKTSTNEVENSLTQGLEALQRTLLDTIASDDLSYPSNMTNYMEQMVVAVNRLSTLEGLVRQADNLRQQTLHQLHQMLTTHQAAQCFLVVAEYFHRLRALSSLWIARPRQE